MKSVGKQHSECEMALDLRFDSGFKNLCVEREKVQGRQERGEGKKVKRKGDKEKKAGEGMEQEKRKELGTERRVACHRCG